jgi:RimJ/RimL family protein N-acetyltransferase
MANPVLRDIPYEFNSERLLIRCPRAGDGLIVHEAVVESLSGLRAFPASLPWAMAEPSVDASEQFCRESQANYQLRTSLPMLLLLKSSGDLVGSSGLHSIEWSVPKCEIGYWGRPRFARQGLITEAVKAITAFALSNLGMRRVEALPDEQNTSSCRVCERSGYRFEGTRRNDRIDPGGVLRNTCVYAVTA